MTTRKYPPDTNQSIARIVDQEKRGGEDTRDKRQHASAHPNAQLISIPPSEMVQGGDVCLGCGTALQ